ncbi:hypothetical protein HGRIS_003200 [Hohenbuehelia grisea]|uniref:Secreted protein n=1 Tax=Hohenbuehelia grisea TaxID=104357 RepID=A0ABR3JP45_9AGAR
MKCVSFFGVLALGAMGVVAKETYCWCMDAPEDTKYICGQYFDVDPPSSPCVVSDPQTFVHACRGFGLVADCWTLDGNTAFRAASILSRRLAKCLLTCVP